MQGDVVRGEECFQQGLNYNEFHYRCLTGLFDLQMQQGRSTEAYLTLKKVSDTFPMTQSRLDTILRLAIKNNAFEDVSGYYGTFVAMEVRSPDLIKCMAAALVVTGKHFLAQNMVDVGEQCFKNALISSGRAPAVFKQIVTTLVQFEQFSIAEMFLKDALPAFHTDPVYLSMEYLVYDGLEPPVRSVERGRRLIEKGIFDISLYERMIKRSLEAKLNKYAQGLAMDAANRWTEHRERFLSLVSHLDEPR